MPAVFLLADFVEDDCLEVCNLSLWNSSRLSEIGPKRRRGWRYFRDRKSMIEWEGAREKGRNGGRLRSDIHYITLLRGTVVSMVE